jgi:hypothetical protein
MRWRNDSQRENLFRRVELVILRDDGTLSLKLLDAGFRDAGWPPGMELCPADIHPSP